MLVWSATWSKKRNPYYDKNSGVFGSVVKARALHSVTEAQARGALHLHALLWLLYGPLWFSRHIHDEDFRCKIGKYIDKILTVSISEAEHAPPRIFTYSKTLHNVSEIKRGREIASHTQYHHHTARCRKLPSGKDKCELGRPCVQSNATEFD